MASILKEEHLAGLAGLPHPQRVVGMERLAGTDESSADIGLGSTETMALLVLVVGLHFPDDTQAH